MVHYICTTQLHYGCTTGDGMPALQVRITNEEYEVAKGRAAEAGLSLSGWMRSRLLGEVPIEKEPPFDEAQLRRLVQAEVVKFLAAGGQPAGKSGHAVDSSQRAVPAVQPPPPDNETYVDTEDACNRCGCPKGSPLPGPACALRGQRYGCPCHTGVQP